jgi:hypothetical protein
MKTHILKQSIALLLAALPMAQAQDDKKVEKIENKDDKKVEQNKSVSSSVKAEADGSVTVEIDVNGKKERKTFKLGDGQPFTWKFDDNGAVGAVSGRVGELLRDKLLAGKTEKVTWLGVAAEPVGDDVRAQLPLQAGEGLSVRHVMPDSPAAKAGLEEHDILTRLDDQILVSSEQFKSLVKMRKPGDSVKLTYLRKGEKKEATAALVEHEGEIQRDVIQFLKGPDGKFDLQAANGRIKEMEERLRTMKEKLPGIIVDKKSFLIGPDGIMKKVDSQKIAEAIDNVRKKLEEANVSPEEREQIRKSLEEAIRNAREAVEKVEDLVKKNQNQNLDKKLEDKKP